MSCKFMISVSCLLQVCSSEPVYNLLAPDRLNHLIACKLTPQDAVKCGFEVIRDCNSQLVVSGIDFGTALRSGDRSV